MPSTRLIVRGAPLSQSFKGDLNKLWAAMLDRLEVISPFGEVQVQIGGLQPTSNKGPWLKDGSKWYVWDESSKTYVPLDISESLGPVSSMITAALAPYATTSAVTAAIATAIGTIPTPAGTPSAHFAARQTTGLTSGALTNSGTTVDVPFNTEDIDTEEGFGGGRYTVKKSGFYSITVVVHTEVTAGSASAVTIVTSLSVNGGVVRQATPGFDAQGSCIFEINYQGQLTVGDHITVSVDFSVSGGPVTMGISSNNTRISGFLTP